MMISVVYEVLEVEYTLIGGPIYRNGVDKSEEIPLRCIFFTNENEATYEVRKWAKEHEVKTQHNDWFAERTDLKHHNDWTIGVPEYDVKNITVYKHTMDYGNFYTRARSG